MRIHSGTLPKNVVVQNLHQEVRMHHNENLVGWQRRLRFGDEEIWTELPESVREQCRALWRQVLASILKTSERRQCAPWIIEKKVRIEHTGAVAA